MSDLSKPDTLLHKTHMKVLLVPRFDMCRSILLLSKIAHQLWHDHTLSHRNRTTERIVWVDVRGERKAEDRVLDKI